MKKRHAHSYFIEGDTAVFPLWSFAGRLDGIINYRPHLPKKAEGLGKKYLPEHNSNALFGTQNFNRNNTTIFIVEGIFDACVFHAIGANSLAVLSNDLGKDKLNLLYKLPYTLVAVCDNDKAGRKLGKHFKHVVYSDLGKDPADMGLDWAKEVVNAFR